MYVGKLLTAGEFYVYDGNCDDWKLQIICQKYRFLEY